MKILINIYNFFVVLLVLLVINYFVKVVVLPQWLIIGILVISLLLFFVKTYLRFKRR